MLMQFSEERGNHSISLHPSSSCKCSYISSIKLNENGHWNSKRAGRVKGEKEETGRCGSLQYREWPLGFSTE